MALKLTSAMVKDAAGPAAALGSAFTAGFARGHFPKHRKLLLFGGFGAGAGLFLFAKNPIIKDVGIGLAASSIVGLFTQKQDW